MLGRFLAAARPEQLPEAIPIETVPAYRWRSDSGVALAARGYAAFLEGEGGNTLFLRHGDGGQGTAPR